MRREVRAHLRSRDGVTQTGFVQERRMRNEKPRMPQFLALRLKKREGQYMSWGIQQGSTYEGI